MRTAGRRVSWLGNGWSPRPLLFDSAQSLHHRSNRSGGASTSLRRGDGGRAGLEPPDGTMRLVRAGDAPPDGVGGEFPWDGAGRLSGAVRRYVFSAGQGRTAGRGVKENPVGGSCGGPVVHGDCRSYLPGEAQRYEAEGDDPGLSDAGALSAWTVSALLLLPAGPSRGSCRVLAQSMRSRAVVTMLSVSMLW